MRSILIVCAAAAALLISGSCDRGTKNTVPQPAAQAQQKPEETRRLYTGTVAETMNAASYTYVLLDTGIEKVWFAGPACAVAAGERLSLPPGMVKEHFTSKTLNRMFEKIHFIGSIKPAEGAALCKMPPAADAGITPAPDEGRSHTAPPSGQDIDFSGIARPGGGKTVAELYAEKKELADTPVVLGGKVVKFSERIMGKNWVHVQDGTGVAGSHDITVTTQDSAQVGDVVLVRGTLSLDRDFGYGYSYALLIEDAAMTKQ